MRIFFLSDTTAQTWHRAWLPVRNLAPILAHEGIDLHIRSDIPLDYDAYVIQRKPLPWVIPYINHLHDHKKKIVLSLDDDLWHVPKWNQSHAFYNDPFIINWLRDIATEVWVSTVELQEVVGRGVVLPNLIDTDYWTCVERPVNERLRILWAGSACHDPDIEIVAQVFERLWSRFPDLLLLFFGSFPESMSYWCRIGGSHKATMIPLPKYAGRLGFAQPVSIEEYPATLAAINPDVCVAALADEPFAHCKSNLKALEMSMVGSPTVATDLPPYKDCEIRVHDVDEMYEWCRHLLEKPAVRQRIGQRAREDVMRNWTWKSPKRNLWLEAIRRLA